MKKIGAGDEVPWLLRSSGSALPIVNKKIPRARREALLAATKFVYCHRRIKKKVCEHGQFRTRSGDYLGLIWIENFRLEMLIPTRERHMMSASVSIPTEFPNARFLSE